MENKEKNQKEFAHNIAKIFQLLFLSPLIFVGMNVVLKYFTLSLKYGQYAKTEVPKDFFKFKTEYLYNGIENVPPFLAAMMAMVAAMFIVIRMDIRWHVKHDADNLKSDDRWMNAKELKENFVPVKFDKLDYCEEGGIMVAMKGKKVYLDTENIHTLVIGTTRSGKGQLVILPLIYTISTVEEKQSFITNDMKGDALESTYSILEENGYNVYVLNLDDATRSDEWDLLHEAKKEYLKVIEDDEPDLSNCNKIIDSIASLFTDNPKSDPIWPDSAHALLMAMILYLIEQGYKSGQLDKVTMPSVYHFFVTYGSHDEIRDKIRVNALDEIFRNLPVGNPARAAYASSNFAKGEMRGSIFSTLATNLKIFSTDMGVQKITSGNTIDFSKIVVPDGKPCAIFIILPDEDRSRDIIASAFVNQCYDYLVKQAKKYPRKMLPRRVQFILDEFANMPRIPAMDNKTSIGAGHNILFTLVVQSLNQLDDKYGTMAKSIRGTCGNVMYINSIDKDTNQYISALLGSEQFDITTYSGNLNEWLSHQNLSHETKPLMSATQLGRMKKGKAVIIRQRSYPIITKFKMFYKYGIPVTSIEDIPLHEIKRKVRDSFYPIKDFQESIGMNVVPDPDNKEVPQQFPVTNNADNDIDTIDFGDDNVEDFEGEQAESANRLQEIYDKLNKATQNEFDCCMKERDIKKAYQLAQKACKFQRAISPEELELVEAELSQYY